MVKMPNALSKIASQLPVIKNRKRLTPEEQIAKLKKEFGLGHGKGKRKKKGKKRK